MMSNYVPWPSTSGSNFGHVQRYPMIAPDDPRNERYLTICYVCQEESKPGQEHLRNYGGIVCYSCRAFWRRSHQKSRNPKFVCKKGDNCFITVKTRRRCQKCRYNRCLMTGMNPDAVLDEDQKKIRFRKLLLKRQRLQSNGQDDDGAHFQDDDSENENISGEDHSELDNSLVRNDQQKIESRKAEEQHQQHQQHQQQQDAFQLSDSSCSSFNQIVPMYSSQKVIPIFSSQNNELDPPHSMSQIVDEDDKESDPEKLLPKIKSIVRSYQMAVAQTKCQKSDELFAKLNAIQRGVTGVSVSKGDVLFLITKMSDLFRHFAILQRPFAVLDKSDQRQLLGRNTPLFVQLFMGCYLLAQSSHIPYKSQIENCLGKKAWMNNFFQNLHLEKFNSITNLFCPNADLDHYGRLINRLKGLPILTSFEQKSVLSYVILFDHDKEMNLESKTELTDQSILNENLYNSRIRTCENCLDLSSLSKTLVEMAAFCAQNISWDISDLPMEDDVSTFSHFDMYTREEESWISMQFKLVDDAFRSVTGGEQLIQEYLACSAGISPLPESHIPTLLRVLLERARRVFKIHPEFEALPDEKQRRLMELNGPLALALSALKAETCSTGMEQLQDGFGELDERRWRQNYLPYIANPADIKKVSLAKDPNVPPEVLRAHRNLVERLKILTIDPEMYKLSLLLILTQQPVPGENPGMDLVHSRYETLLRRRVHWLCQQNSNFGDANQIVCNIFACHNQLPQLALLLQAIMLRGQ